MFVMNQTVKEFELSFELKRDVQAEVILNQLYKLTSLQTTFGVNNIALVNNEPKNFNT